jgi:DNA-binding MarR family transcriptional regulator
MAQGAARTSDPETSHEAANSVDANALEEAVAEVVYRNYSYGATSWEIARTLGMVHQTVSPRLAPLRRKGYIRPKYDPETGKMRKRLAGSNRGQIIWFYVPKDERVYAAAEAIRMDQLNDARRKNKSTA